MLTDFRKRKDSERAELAKEDPMKGYWASMQADEMMKAFDWRVDYAEDRWFFEVKRKNPNADKNLALWFDRMWEWLKPLVQKPAKGEVSGGGPKILKSDISEISDAEIEQLAKAGPFATFTRVFGADSPQTIQVKALSWKDLHIDNPIEAIRDLLLQQANH